MIPANTSVIVKGRMGAQKGLSVSMIQPVETLPASVVQADNSHRGDVVLTNVSCRRMEIPKRRKIANMINRVIIDRDKTVGDLPHSDVLSDGSCREGTTSEVPVDLDITDFSGEQNKRVQVLFQDFLDKFASWTMQLEKAVGV